MRPLTKVPAPITYAEPAPTLVIRMNAPRGPMTIQQIYAFLGTQNWLALEAKPIRTPLEDQAIEDKKFYLDKLTDIYPEARRDLIANLDELCSYCGMPIRDDAHVEHILPKSYFPAQCLLWNNFLLACRDCNSRKSNTPSGAVNDTQAHYAWPHSTLQGQMITYKLVGYTQYVENQDYRIPAIAGFVETGALVRLIHSNQIRIEMPTIDHREVVMAGATSTNLAVLAFGHTPEAKETVATLLDLNRYTGTKDVSDRRLIERTQAWIQAIDAVRNLYVVQRQADAVRQAVLQQVADTIRATGFWSVWATVFVVEAVNLLPVDDRRLIKDYLLGNAFSGTCKTRLYFS